MYEPRTLDRLRDEYDTTQLLEAVDALDQIRNILADGPNLEPPEIRDQLLKLHTLAHRVINEGYPLAEDPDDNPGLLACEIESTISYLTALICCD